MDKAKFFVVIQLIMHGGACPTSFFGLARLAKPITCRLVAGKSNSIKEGSVDVSNALRIKKPQSPWRTAAS